MTGERGSGGAPRYVPSALRLSGGFAFVMATGIVSIAAGLVGMPIISIALFALNLIAFPGLWIAVAAGLLRGPAAMFVELHDRSRAPSLLTAVAATCVLGDEIALSGADPSVVTGLWVLAAMLWVGLTYAAIALITIGQSKPQSSSGSMAAGFWRWSRPRLWRFYRPGRRAPPRRRRLSSAAWRCFCSAPRSTAS